MFRFSHNYITFAVLHFTLNCVLSVLYLWSVMDYLYSFISMVQHVNIHTKLANKMKSGQLHSTVNKPFNIMMYFIILTWFCSPKMTCWFSSPLLIDTTLDCVHIKLIPSRLTEVTESRQGYERTCIWVMSVAFISLSCYTLLDFGTALMAFCVFFCFFFCGIHLKN